LVRRGETAADAAELPVIHAGFLVTALAMVWLSLAAVRNLPLAGLVAAPLVADGLAYAADGVAALAGRICGGVRTLLRAAGGAGAAERCAAQGVAWLHSRRTHRVAQLLLACFLLLIYRAIVSERHYEALGWRMRFAIGYSDHEHPLAAADFLARNRAAIDSPVFYGDTRSANLVLARFGPEWPVYFDARHAEIYPPATFRLAAKTRWDFATFQQEAAKYGMRLAGFSLTDLKEDRSPLAVALGRTNSWSLVYPDDCAALFAGRGGSSQDGVIARYGLTVAPTNLLLQRPVFGEWLKRQGRDTLADLDDPSNRALEEGVAARWVVRVLQFNGLWAPRRDLVAMRLCRLAKFLDHLGWSVVADDLYQQALQRPAAWRVTLPRAIRQARKVMCAATDPLLREEMRQRVRERAGLLLQLDPGNPALFPFPEPGAHARGASQDRFLPRFEEDRTAHHRDAKQK
jgi:hypothetical protein